MFKRITLLNVTLLSTALASAQFATAEQPKPGNFSSKIFGTQYSTVAPVSDRQAQIVYYRANDGQAQKGAAHVYVDREFHTGLLPGGYSAFCVTPGSHSLGAYVNDAPLYKGKTSNVFAANLEGGKTYFLRVREDSISAPQTITRVDAERELTGMRLQTQALSRASTVQACDHLPMTEAHKDYALSSDVLFAFGKSGYKNISTEGREAIRQLISQVQQENGNLDRVEVVGHTDPIGSSASNYLLGLKRAQTVRRMLVESGFPASAVIASSAGSSEPANNGCYGSRAEQIKCYAEDRRVVVRVNTQR